MKTKKISRGRTATPAKAEECISYQLPAFRHTSKGTIRFPGVPAPNAFGPVTAASLPLITENNWGGAG